MEGLSPPILYKNVHSNRTKYVLVIKGGGRSIHGGRETPDILNGKGREGKGRNRISTDNKDMILSERLQWA